MPPTEEKGTESAVLLSRPSENNGRGTAGTEIALRVNSFPLHLRVKSISVYDVVFIPALPSDALNKRKKIVVSCADQLRDTYGVWFYDNTRIWSVEVAEGIHEFESPTLNWKFTIRYLKTVELENVTLEEQEMITHIILGKCIRKSKLVRIGRNYFDATQLDDPDTNRVNERGFPILKLWQGYSIAVEKTQAGLQLKCDVFHRVLQNRSVRDVMDEIEKDVKRSMSKRSEQEQADEIENRAIAELVGQAVITMYNKRVWRIHGVDYHTSPQDSFVQDNGEEISYAEYYKQKYDVKTMSKKRGMLVHIPKKKGKNDPDRRIILHPETCFLTGLTKKMKENYRFMRQMADKTRLGAGNRFKKAQDAVRQLEGVVTSENKLAIAKQRDCKVEEVNLNEVEESLLEMPMHINADQDPLTGRVLDPIFATVLKDNHEKQFNMLRAFNKEWGRCGFVNEKLKKIKYWSVFYEANERSNCHELFMPRIERLASEQRIWGKVLSDRPKLIEVPDFATKRKAQHAVWEKTIRKHLKKEDPQLIVCILPQQTTSAGAIYAGIKDVTTSENCCLSQCIQAKNVQDGNRLDAILRNLLKQIMTKAGNTPWKVSFNLPGNSLNFEKTTMIIGIDVNHDLARANSTVGFCASYDKDVTKYFSYVSTQERGQEIVKDAKKLMKKALKDFYEKWKTLPQNIVCFRDGVSNSQLEAVVEGEVKQMLAAFDYIKEKYPKWIVKKSNPDKVYWKPKLSVIIVQKRVTARFLTDQTKPVPPGTIVDHGVVSSNFWDFYMVPCEAPQQGTASSTRYIVCWNDIGMKPDDIQALCHNLCNLYFNWPGPVRVPAPCMYASKLAYLFGTAMSNKQPHEDHYDLLYFL